jgi:uncharacterized protein YaaQ
MKLIIAIVNDNDSDTVSQVLLDSDFRVTTIASSGGFLRKGRKTLLCGVEDNQLQTALYMIRKAFPPAKKDEEKRCTLFVINVADYLHF